MIQRKHIVTLFATIILSSGFLCACGTTEESDILTTEPETTTVKEVETTTEQESTTEKETKFNIYDYDYKGNRFPIGEENKIVVDRVLNRVIKNGEAVYANELIGDEEVEGADLSRGGIVLGLMRSMDLDISELNEKYDAERAALIPFEDNYSFVNNSGHDYIIEYVGYDEECKWDVFDVYPIN